MKKFILAISVFILFGSPSANAEQVYYCASELATGLIKDKKTGKWSETSFQKQRYTIKFNDDYTKVEGLTSASFYCKKPLFDEIHLTCYQKYDSGDMLVFNKDNLRFLYVYGNSSGYLFNKSNSDTNTMNAGTCQKF